MICTVTRGGVENNSTRKESDRMANQYLFSIPVIEREYLNKFACIGSTRLEFVGVSKGWINHPDTQM